MYPRVAIVGRPNVGKSSLFNWLAGRRIAIVDPTAGVTRDRIIAPVTAHDITFELIDTGGMGIADVDNLTAQVEAQIKAALQQADVILFVVDVRDGLVPLDQSVAEKLRAIDKPVVHVVNKCDFAELDGHAGEFYRFGADQLVCVSAQQNRGKDELIDAIIAKLPTGPFQRVEPTVTLELAIVGRRNTGKSTFINSLAQEERTIVSEVPGTTRDSIDVRFDLDGRSIIAIDTAGVRRKGSIASDIEFYSLARAERSIRRADVTLLFLDPRMKISKVDKQLAGYIFDQYKPAIFVVNKWDLAVDTIRTGEFGDYIRKTFPNLDHVPMAFITAKDGKNVQAVLNLAQNLSKQAKARVDTAELNRVLRQALEDAPPPMRQNRRPKINFGTQVATEPPTLVLFTNGPELFDVTYQRYLIKTFRDRLPFQEVPIKMYLRHKHRDDVRNTADALPGEENSATAAPNGKTPAKVRTRPSKQRPPKRTPELWTDL